MQVPKRSVNLLYLILSGKTRSTCCTTVGLLQELLLCFLAGTNGDKARLPLFRELTLRRRSQVRSISCNHLIGGDAIDMGRQSSDGVIFNCKYNILNPALSSRSLLCFLIPTELLEYSGKGGVNREIIVCSSLQSSLSVSSLHLSTARPLAVIIFWVPQNENTDVWSQKPRFIDATHEVTHRQQAGELQEPLPHDIGSWNKESPVCCLSKPTRAVSAPSGG